MIFFDNNISIILSTFNFVIYLTNIFASKIIHQFHIFVMSIMIETFLVLSTILTKNTYYCVSMCAVHIFAKII